MLQAGTRRTPANHGGREPRGGSYSAGFLLWADAEAVAEGRSANVSAHQFRPWDYRSRPRALAVIITATSTAPSRNAT